MERPEWIKLYINMFDDDLMDYFSTLPDGDSILLVWIRLNILAGKSNMHGFLMIRENIPYTDAMLCTALKKNESTLKYIISIFLQFGMLEKTEKGYYIPTFEKEQNENSLEKIREKARNRKRAERERKAQLLLGMNENSKSEEPDEDENCDKRDMSQNVTRDKRDCHATEIRNKNIENKDNINNNSNELLSSERSDEAPAETKKETQKIDWINIKCAFESACDTLPRIRAMTDSRKSNVRSLAKALIKDGFFPAGTTVEEIMFELFDRVDESDFLSGRNGKWTACDFDWIIKKANAVKILEGKYDNKTKDREEGAENGSAGYNGRAYEDIGQSAEDDARRFFRGSGL